MLIQKLERKHEPLLPRRRFLGRVLKALGVVLAIVLVALGIGVTGYHGIAHLTWMDALLNASMILTGMGPVAPMTTTAAKLFASLYALFSGVVFLSAVGIFVAPIFHRIMHHFHLPEDANDAEA